MSPPLMEALGLCELEHHLKNTAALGVRDERSLELIGEAGKVIGPRV